MILEIDYDKCTKCMECVEICISKALTYTDGKFIFNSDECTYCEVCFDVCEPGAIKLMGENLDDY